MKQALLIPIYMPNDKVVPFLKRMNPKDFSAFVVVDDGSGEASRPLFDEIRALPGFEVISYPENAGKGHALKTAFEFIRANRPDIGGVVTADGDGQHAYEDILRVRDAPRGQPRLPRHGGSRFLGKKRSAAQPLGQPFLEPLFPSRRPRQTS
ncbi:MAG: glycosyltransferase [Bacilli bacterium]|jgi:dolichol-phosphate mannosyltransferase|nr:glycosyltransferase [Bacilli bacterium]